MDTWLPPPSPPTKPEFYQTIGGQWLKISPKHTASDAASESKSSFFTMPSSVSACTPTEQAERNEVTRTATPRNTKPAFRAGMDIRVLLPLSCITSWNPCAELLTVLADAAKFAKPDIGRPRAFEDVKGRSDLRTGAKGRDDYDFPFHLLAKLHLFLKQRLYFLPIHLTAILPAQDKGDSSGMNYHQDEYQQSLDWKVPIAEAVLVNKLTPELDFVCSPQWKPPRFTKHLYTLASEAEAELIQQRSVYGVRGVSLIFLAVAPN